MLFKLLYQMQTYMTEYLSNNIINIIKQIFIQE